MPMAPMYILIILIELIRTLPKEHHRITCHSQERTQLSTRGGPKTRRQNTWRRVCCLAATWQWTAAVAGSLHGRLSTNSV